MKDNKGFTLLEVMIALMILAMALAVITTGNSTAINHVARVTRMTTASFLLEGVVNDIHAYYQRKGFPSNTIEDRECELPRDFSDTFQCRFDLKAINLTPDQVQTLVQQGMDVLSGVQTETAKAGVQEGSGGVSPDLTQLAMLAPLFGPEGEQLINMCQINIGALIMGLNALVQYMPTIIEQVAKRTRQLNVRLSWKEGPRLNRKIEITTFIVSLPEEEVQALKEAERAREIQEEIRNMIPSTAPSVHKGR